MTQVLNAVKTSKKVATKKATKKKAVKSESVILKTQVNQRYSMTRHPQRRASAAAHGAIKA